MSVFNVVADAAGTIHAHGYDYEKDVGPGNPAKFEFKASIEGIFEVELENTGVEILTLRVNP